MSDSTPPQSPRDSDDSGNELRELFEGAIKDELAGTVPRSRLDLVPCLTIIQKAATCCLTILDAIVERPAVARDKKAMHDAGELFRLLNGIGATIEMALRAVEGKGSLPPGL
jgi:hypothetical protein